MKKEVVITADGSPSLAFYKDDKSQMMHSSLGAYSETEYIYVEALKYLLDNTNEEVHMLCVGMGFAYIEIACILFCLEHDIPIYIVTYEAEQDLIDAIKIYLEGDGGKYHKELDTILSLYSRQYQLEPRRIQAVLKQKLTDQSWQIRGGFYFQELNEKFNLIQFDAFCSKFQTEMWQEKALAQWLQQHASKNCVFATYAAKGSLKRSLKTNQFSLLKRKGFAEKRESTLAHRFSNDKKC